MVLPRADASAASPPLPRAVVINLPRHPGRLAHAQRELSKAGMRLHLIDAVDGAAMKAEERARNVTALGRWFLTPGMAGCFLSHRRCWEECVSSGRPLMVFEDDVVLARDFRCRAAAALAAMPQVEDGDSGGWAWDVLLLGALGCVHPQGRFGFNWAPALVGGRWRRPRRVALIENLPPATREGGVSKNHDDGGGGVPPTLHVPLCPYGMHAYVLSPRGAAKLLSRCPRASFHVDVVAWGHGDLDLFACHPLLAWQTHNDTTIGGLHSRWQGLSLPMFTADRYTGFEFGWAWSAPLLCVGGPHGFLLTNGRAIGLMLTGLIASALMRSRIILGVTLVYVAIVVAIVRLLASQ